MMDQIKAWLDTLNDRERRLVYAGVVVAAVLLVYQFMWSPFVGGVETMQKKVDQQQKDLVWMQGNMTELHELLRTAVKTDAAGRSIYAMIETSAREKFGGNVQVSQEGQKVRVVLTNVSFNDVMNWLDGLQTQQQVAIKEFNSETTAVAGYVKSSILLDG